MVEQYYLDLIYKEQKELPNLFLEYLPKNYLPKRILNFCCGIVNEEPILYNLYGKNIEMISFDNSEFMDKMAKNLNRKSFLKLDIKKIKEFATEKYDLIIGRNIPINSNYNHPIELDYQDYWPIFLNDINKYLNSSSLLFMTLAREDEFNRTKEILTNLKYKIQIQEKNKIFIPSDRIGIAGADVKDNYVILAKLSNGNHST